MTKRNFWLQILLLVLCTIIFSACGQAKELNIDDWFADNRESIIRAVIEHYEDGDISEADIEVSEIYYGAFSQEKEEEILVICDILNQPHVAGLDKAVCLLLTADSFEVKAYKEFASDDTVIKCYRAEDGQNRIWVSEKTTYQGITSSETALFLIQDKQWSKRAIDELEELEEVPPFKLLPSQ